MKRQVRIFVAELNRSFESYAAAGKQLGIDPSNIRKAATGKRPTAGGYHFAVYSNVSSDADRQSYISGIKVYPEAVEKKRAERRKASSERVKLIDDLHAQLVRLNDTLRAYKKQGITGNKAMDNALTLIDTIGRNKRGGFDSSKTNLRRLSNAELENASRLIARSGDGAITEEEYRRQLATTAAKLGLTEQQAAKYEDVSPLLYRALKRVRQEGEFKYDEFWSDVHYQMDEGISTEALIDLTLDVAEYYSGSTPESLESILNRFNERAMEERKESEYEEDYNGLFFWEF